MCQITVSSYIAAPHGPMAKGLKARTKTAKTVKDTGGQSRRHGQRSRTTCQSIIYFGNIVSILQPIERSSEMCRYVQHHPALYREVPVLHHRFIPVALVHGDHPELSLGPLHTPRRHQDPLYPRRRVRKQDVRMFKLVSKTWSLGRGFHGEMYLLYRKTTSMRMMLPLGVFHTCHANQDTLPQSVNHTASLSIHINTPHLSIETHKAQLRYHTTRNVLL